MCTHSELSESLLRPPGIPPSTCRGAMARVSPDGTPIDWDAPGIVDEAQASEGDVGQTCEVRLYRCGRCRNCLVVATCPDGERRSRNDWAEKYDPVNEERIEKKRLAAAPAE